MYNLFFTMDTVKSFIGSQCVLIETQFLFGHMFERAPTALSLIRIWSDLSTIMLATLPMISTVGRLFQLHSTVTLQLLILLHYGFSSCNPRKPNSILSSG